MRLGLKDPSPHVRYEAVRGYGRQVAARTGCQPLLDTINDPDPSVQLLAIDLLGDLCKDSENVTTRLTAEARVPSSLEWHRETHAFVALSKRSPDAVATEMEAFVTHPVWWVRMYATFAAAGAKDLLHLDKLAYDANDNVREAALNHLQALDKERAELATVAALEREDVQLLRTAALLLKQTPQSGRFVRPLLGALQRLTKTRSETTRDARLALLDTIERHGKADDSTELEPFLKDYDPRVADQAAFVITHLSGRTLKVEPQPKPHLVSQPFGDLRQCVTIDMSPGGAIHLRMAPDLAPIAVEQFLKLATMEKYYNGLTFHRIAPNFVIQGGSRGANEYVGAPQYMRDEIGGWHVRGAVGLSTRGRNTGDAQIFINLVDNPRLDTNYTVFAHVFAEDMDRVDRIQEGAVMRSIAMTSCPPPRR
jgi:peptidyl-prolyl cis-trans isomerase B (cyclophilin B)